MRLFGWLRGCDGAHIVGSEYRPGLAIARVRAAWWRRAIAWLLVWRRARPRKLFVEIAMPADLGGGRQLVPVDDHGALRCPPHTWPIGSERCTWCGEPDTRISEPVRLRAVARDGEAVAVTVEPDTLCEIANPTPRWARDVPMPRPPNRRRD